MHSCYEKPITEAMPMYYFSGTRLSKSDRDFIEGRLTAIPKGYKLRVCVRYDAIYRSSKNKRLDANTYLNRVAKYFYGKSK